MLKNSNSVPEYVLAKEVISSEARNLRKNKGISRPGGLEMTNGSFFIFLFFYFFIFPIFCFSVSFAQGEFKYDAGGHRNPFLALVTPEGRILKLDKQEQTGDLLLEGIIYDPNGNSAAVVNGNVVSVSDFAGDYQVLKIESDKVVFIKDGQMTEIELKKGEE